VKTGLSITEVKGSSRAPYAYKVEMQYDDVDVVPRDYIQYLNFTTNPKKMFYARSKNEYPVSDDGLNIPRFLETRMEELFSKRGAVMRQGMLQSDIKYDSDNMPIPHDSDLMPPSLKVLDYWKALKKSPPVKAHAIARALQLLDANAILNSRVKTATTNVCNLDFPFIKDHSLPNPAASITSEYSIGILNHLFFTKLVDNKKLEIANMREYVDFVKILEAKFSRLSGTRKNRGNTDRLSNIKDFMMPFCKGSEGQTFELNNSSHINSIRPYARKLIERQGEHMRDALNILFKLFDRRHLYDGQFSFSEQLKRGGISALNAITEDARNVLIKYFTDCEEIYKNGLIQIYKIYKEHGKDGKPKEFKALRPNNRMIYRKDERNKNNENEEENENEEDYENLERALNRKRRRTRKRRTGFFF
jgi:hypothetical protein